MPAFITFGRILFSVIFIVSGARKLLDIAATTALTQRITFPDVAMPYVTQLEGITSMPMAQMLAIAAGALELVGGILIALNFGARFFAILLILFVLAATFYFHDFWNQTGQEAATNTIMALKNLSIIGGLFMIAGIGKSRRSDPVYGEV